MIKMIFDKKKFLFPPRFRMVILYTFGHHGSGETCSQGFSRAGRWSGGQNDI
jgi:hypothetical protein